MFIMRKIKEFIDLIGEAPATDDYEIIQTLNSADIELETLVTRFGSLIKKSHNNPVQANTPARTERDLAKEPIYNRLEIINSLLQKL
jgi:hypothetical protein